MTRTSQIIPVASGKGGVGKSIFTANLAATLAKNNKKVIAIDLDLGGSNLYSYLGLKNIYPGIGDYLREKSALENYLVETSIDGLSFLAGEGKTPFLANIQHARKTKLLKEIKKLDADYILLDLGAGTTFNTLDFFGMVKNGIVLTTFEYPALMNTLSFLKNFLFRLMLRTVKDNYGLTKKLNDAYKVHTEENPVKYSTLLQLIQSIDPEKVQMVNREYKSYIPRLVFNFGRAPEDLKIIERIDASIKDILSLDVFYFGYVPYDNNILESVSKSQLFVENNTDSLAAGFLQNIASKIMENRQITPDSKKELVVETYDYIKSWIL